MLPQIDPTNQDKWIVRTSDRGNFKKCRLAWHFGSKVRLNYEPLRLPNYLEFGTAIHAALEVYYDPTTWTMDREVIASLSIMRFEEVHKQNRQRQLTLTNQESLEEDVQQDWDYHLNLGRGMLKNYFNWARPRDNFTPTHTEVEFEVPIPVAPSISLPSRFENRSGDLFFQGLPVVYQGRIDLMIEDQHGEYWVDDHKTAGQMREDVLTFLELDEQTGSYCWAIQEMLGVKVAGALYNELYKGVPEPPQMNKNKRMGRWYSVSKSQDTSYDLYLETVRAEDPEAYDAGLYDEMLQYLQASGNKYFRRTQIHRSPQELQNLGYRICLEAIDMFDDPRIYPNPTRFHCNGCWFRGPCLALNDGSDVDWLLKENYVKRG